MAELKKKPLFKSGRGYGSTLAPDCRGKYDKLK